MKNDIIRNDCFDLLQTYNVMSNINMRDAIDKTHKKYS